MHFLFHVCFMCIHTNMYTLVCEYSNFLFFCILFPLLFYKRVLWAITITSPLSYRVFLN